MDNWKMVSDVTVLKILQDNYGKVTPIITEMLHGKEIKTPQGILRMKKTND